MPHAAACHLSRLLTRLLRVGTLYGPVAICLGLTASVSWAQDPGGAERAPDLSYVLEDLNRDFIPDHVGERLTVEGYATMTPRRAREELIIEEIQPTQRTVEVEPVDIMAADAAGERLMHRLVRLVGTLREFNGQRDVAILYDSSGSIEIRIPGRLTADVDLANKVLSGGRVTVVGILSQSDGQPPFDSEYRVQPRTPADFSWAPSSLGTRAPLFLLFLLSVVSLGALAYREWKAGRPSAALEMLTSELEESQRSLERSSHEYRDLFEDDTLARFVLDKDGKIQRWNLAFEAFVGLGAEDIEGRPLDALDLQLDEAELDGADAGVVVQGEVRTTSPVGPRVGLLTLAGATEGRPSRYGSIVDVTRRAELEAQLARAQKMDALGRLAGGVAHDINNMLTTILGNAEASLAQGSLDADVRRALQEIQEAAERSARLTGQLLTMGRRDMARPEPMNLNNVVGDMAPMLQRVIGTDIELVTLLSDSLPAVIADMSRMEQLLLNLVTNAREAMPKGGKVVIETARVITGPGEDEHVRLRISDNGIGMESGTRARVFEPFFSTKPDGTGLGLATVYGIVADCGGTIDLTSELGQGTTVGILFPSAGVEATEVASADHALATEALGLTVLVAEDEAGVRELVRRVLEGAGCQVTVASNGEEALRIFETDPGKFDVLVTDLVMPILTGEELTDRVTAIRSGFPVVLMSGYVDGADAQHKVSKTRFFVQKPFRTAELIQAVDRAVGWQAAAETPPPPHFH